MSTKRKMMTPKEFRRQGFLRELNRQFLHPLGLALEVVTDDDGTERFGEVWDLREDPEGFIFDDSILATKKAREQRDKIENLFESKSRNRYAALGYDIQPIPEAAPRKTQKKKRVR